MGGHGCYSYGYSYSYNYSYSKAKGSATSHVRSLAFAMREVAREGDQIYL